MVLTNRERSARWRYRLRSDPERYRRYKAEERKRYRNRIEKGSIKPIAELCESEKRKIRNIWRINQRNKRARDKILKHADSKKFVEDNPETMNQCTHRNNQLSKQRGRRKVRKDRAKAYRDLFKLRIELKNERRLKEKYKKRYHRCKKANEDEIEKAVETHLEGEDLRKALSLHVIIARNIKEKYESSKNQKDRKFLRNLIWHKSILKKYKLGKYAMKVTGVKRRQKLDTQINGYKRTSLLKSQVVDYYERDDNSRIRSGKKSTITNKGDKRQVRLLNDSIKNIYAKFLSEKKIKISYSLFCKLKPFWVTRAKENDRNTCLCKTHENVQYKINRMYHENCIITKDLDALIKQICCDDGSKSCMYRECNDCRNKCIITCKADGRQVYWYVWKNTRVERTKNNAKVETQMTWVPCTIKEKTYGTLETLKCELMTDLQRACRHVFNIRHQYTAIKNLKQTLNADSIIVHIDFSENYNCKYSTEIQSMHFGAAQRQISIHTGIAYLHDRQISFSTLSDCLKHSPHAIWAHLSPVLLYLRSQSAATTIHFISDGPTSQYRSKFNFYLLSKEIFAYGLKMATWNFLEAGHGKGAPDGIGAAVKRQADTLVNVHRKDILNASDLISGLNGIGTSIKLFEIEPSRISDYDNQIPANIKPIPETMKVHQVVVTEKLKVKSRVLSCFCSHDCDCFNPATTGFQDTKVSILKKIEVVDETLISAHVVVLHEGQPYPGIVLDVYDNQLDVEVMHKVGSNRFCWPLIEDRMWYDKASIITLLTSPPLQISERHCQIEPEFWNAIVQELKT